MIRKALLPLITLAVALTGCSLMGSSSRNVEAPKEPIIRVRIVETLKEINTIPSGTYHVKTAAGGNLTIEPGAVHVLRVDGDAVVLLKGDEQLTRSSTLRITPSNDEALLHFEGVPYGVGWWWESLQDRSYPGHFLVKPNSEGLLDVIVTLPVEEYLLGVVPQEIGPDSPMEALKAQAVAARSETILALRTNKYAGDGFDICADVACQAYSGTARYSEATAEAISATRGLVLMYDGEPFSAYYASNDGGHSENIENVWPERSGPKPYWKGVPDLIDPTTPLPDLSTEEGIREWIDDRPGTYGNPALVEGLPEWAIRYFRWRTETTAEELTGFVAKHKDIGRVLAIEAVGRGVSGRMLQARFIGEKGEFITGPELAIRQVWNPPLRSAAFVVDVEGPAERPEKFVMRGAGWGHGVGMSQTGAIGRAIKGQDFRQILSHYYQGSTIGSVY
jgi:stage II sporulation protein D